MLRGVPATCMAGLRALTLALTGTGRAQWAATMQRLTPSSQHGLRHLHAPGVAGAAGPSGSGASATTAADSPTGPSAQPTPRANAAACAFITPLGQAGGGGARNNAAPLSDGGGLHRGAPGPPSTSSRGPQGAAALPDSLVFKMLCEHFARPLAFGAAAASAAVPPAPRGPYIVERLHSRTEQQAATLRRLQTHRKICEGTSKPRLREDVQTLKTLSKGTAAILIHPAEDAVTAADALGFVHVLDTRPGREQATTHLNCYHACSGQSVDPRAAALTPVPPCTVVALAHLNGLDWPMLAACTADGAVRIWAQHAHAGEQKLVAAWQSVDINPLPAEPPAAASFHCSAPTHSLYAVGGYCPGVINVWDLACERCSLQIPQGSEFYGSDALHTTSLAGADLTREGTLIATAASDGSVRIFDVRAHRGHPAMRFASVGGNGAPLVGMAVRPSGVMVAATSTFLHFFDVRLTGGTSGQQPSRASFRVEEATRSGRLTALCAHPHAPLFATGSATQVVKIWNERGDIASSIRARQQAPVQRIARTTCMAFAQFDLKLATGASDSLCSIYSMCSEQSRRGDERKSVELESERRSQRGEGENRTLQDSPIAAQIASPQSA